MRMNELVPPTNDTERALTAEILESYIDFFEKTYLFSKDTSKLPVRPVLTRQQMEQRCILCDFADPDQAVLSCRSCGIVVHSTCYHDVLYATLAPGSDSLSQTSKRDSRSSNKSRKSHTSKDASKATESTSSHAKKRRGPHSMDVDEEASSSKNTPSSSRPRSRVRSSTSMDADDSDSLRDDASNIDDEAQSGVELLDVYSAPFSDKVHDDGTWWCAKCSSDNPEKPSCELCGRSNGALFPRFILDENGKPRILSRRRPFMPNQQPKETTEEENTETPQTPNPDSAVAAAALYTPIHFRNWRSDPTRRRGRRPRAPTSAHSEPEDIVWFHDICSRAKPLFYQHLIDPTHIEDEDELTIPASDDEDEESSTLPNADEIPSKSGTKHETPSKSKSSRAPSSAVKSRTNAPKVTSRSRSSEKKTKVMHGDRGRTCRLCGGHTGACVVCSEPECGRHFHAHCAEQFGLVVERDEPLQFKCRMHTPLDPSSTESHLLQLLSEEEEAGLVSELSAHDTTVANHKPLNFGPRPQMPAPAPPQSTYTTGRLSANKQPVRQVTPSYAAPRPSLLPLPAPLPTYLFNYWITKRNAFGHELIHRLRLIKMDEVRKQEILDAVSDMEVNLKKMITLRLYMERIRILADLCKKREGLKRQQLEEFENLMTLPGLAEPASHRDGSRQGYRNSPLVYNSTPNKARKLTERGTPKSLYSSPQAPRTPTNTARPASTPSRNAGGSPNPVGRPRSAVSAQSLRTAATPTSKLARPLGVTGSPGLAAKLERATPKGVAKRGRPKLASPAQRAQSPAPKTSASVASPSQAHARVMPPYSTPTTQRPVPSTLVRPSSPTPTKLVLPNGGTPTKKVEKARKPVTPLKKREESEDEMVDVERVSPRLAQAHAKAAAAASTAIPLANSHMKKEDAGRHDEGVKKHVSHATPTKLLDHKPTAKVSSPTAKSTVDASKAAPSAVKKTLVASASTPSSVPSAPSPAAKKVSSHTTSSHVAKATSPHVAKATSSHVAKASSPSLSSAPSASTHHQSSPTKKIIGTAANSHSTPSTKKEPGSYQAVPSSKVASPMMAAKPTTSVAKVSSSSVPPPSSSASASVSTSANASSKPVAKPTTPVKSIAKPTTPVKSIAKPSSMAPSSTSSAAKPSLTAKPSSSTTSAVPKPLAKPSSSQTSPQPKKTWASIPTSTSTSTQTSTASSSSSPLPVSSSSHKRTAAAAATAVPSSKTASNATPSPTKRRKPTESIASDNEESKVDSKSSSKSSSHKPSLTPSPPRRKPTAATNATYAPTASNAATTPSKAAVAPKKSGNVSSHSTASTAPVATATTATDDTPPLPLDPAAAKRELYNRQRRLQRQREREAKAAAVAAAAATSSGASSGANHVDRNGDDEEEGMPSRKKRNPFPTSPSPQEMNNSSAPTPTRQLRSTDAAMRAAAVAAAVAASSTAPPSPSSHRPFPGMAAPSSPSVRTTRRAAAMAEAARAHQEGGFVAGDDASICTIS